MPPAENLRHFGQRRRTRTGDHGVLGLKMTVALDSIPRFTAAEAAAAAQREFGISATPSALPSERDQNFLLIDAAGRKFVLKIANTQDQAQLLDFQNEAMRLVAAAVPDCQVPCVQPTRAGSDLAVMRHSQTGSQHQLRILSWVEGEVLAKSPQRDVTLLQSLGACMGKIDAALAGFSHSAMHRELQWDIRHAGLARVHLGLLSPAQCRLLLPIFSDWEHIDWASLRHAVIHGDANDYNVIVEGGRVAGLLDFGDMVYSAIVCDLAIALAYAMLDAREPLSIAATVVGSYQLYHPLSQPEQQVLLTLIRCRLAMSVCYAAHNRLRNPDDPYQIVTEASAWDLLTKLQTVPAERACESIRAACAAADAVRLPQ